MTRSEGAPAGAEDEIRAVIEEYEAAIPALLERRDKALRRIAAERNLKQVDVIRMTGYSRETVRQVLDPKVRSAMKKAAEERKSAKEAQAGA